MKTFLFLLLPFLGIAQPWYHQTSIYQIYPRSFYDSNGDGMGDIQGIIAKLDYLQDLGVETLWCSPFFASPQQDFGYDIADYQSIAPEYGTMRDAEQLIAEVHRRDMRIVFDLVMNHTSVQHPWFQADLRRPKSERGDSTDFYLWADKPNNWKAMIGGRAWQYAPERGQYYYAAFLPFQPDLNYRNPRVKQTMLDQARFWLEKGVDGFRLDIFNSIYEDPQLRNNPFSFSAESAFQSRRYTANQPECLQLAEELRSLCDEYGDKLLIGEIIGDRLLSRRYCGDSTNNRLTLAFNFEMLRFRWNARYFDDLVWNMEYDFADPFMPTYVFSNHDRRRSISRLRRRPERASLLQFFQLTTRGVPCLYYGEEIGMRDARLPYRTALDPIPHHIRLSRALMNLINETLNRDELRTPMQWDSTAQAGFSTADTTWLPVNPDYKTVNVAQAQADSFSLWRQAQTLLGLRREHAAFRTGSLEMLPQQALPANVLGYRRLSGDAVFLVYLNFSKQPKRIRQEWGSLLYATGAETRLEGGWLVLGGWQGVVVDGR